MLIRLKNNIKFKTFQSKKKRGFTLIEMIAVIAIIGIISAAIIPNVTSYIKEAKKVKILEQSRKVVLAFETYNMKNNIQLVKGEKISTIILNQEIRNYLDGETLNQLGVESVSIEDCYKIIEGAKFDLDNQGNLIQSTIVTDFSNIGA